MVTSVLRFTQRARERSHAFLLSRSVTNAAMRILVIEDEKKVARFLEQGLREEKYEVDVEYDGDAGISRALAGTYDLVITDLSLIHISEPTSALASSAQ